MSERGGIPFPAEPGPESCIAVIPPAGLKMKGACRAAKQRNAPARWRLNAFNPIGEIPMRLWTLHPKYLDRAGLLALWREALLAQAVLWGKTRGYRKHPQLIRFRNHPEPAAAIGVYLAGILDEAVRRGYRFNAAKIGPCRKIPAIPVTRGQLLYERGHLLGKLALRDCDACRALAQTDEPDSHPLFTIGEGAVESWEKI
jgi:hypothetical protein